ncbi:MAG: hypothetical protein ACFFAS_18130 [Promethearchaeota archaeon]
MSKDLLNQIFLMVVEKGLIDDDFIRYLDTLFLDKSTNILEVIQRGFTKRLYIPSNRVVWAIKAKKSTKTYLIYPRIYCSCQDFYKSVVIKRKRQFCKHILAQTICEALDSFITEKLHDDDFKLIIDETILNM